MVLAAGLGTRLRPFTDRIPKPLIPLHGVPCMEYALLAMREAGLGEVAVNLHTHPGQIRTYLRSDPVPPLRFHESDESRLLLGSAGGIRRMFDVLKEGPVVSMNADVLHLAPLSGLQGKHAELRQKYGVWMTLVLASGEAVARSGGSYREILVDEASGLVRAFGEKKTHVPFFTGTAIFEKEAFSRLAPGAPAEFVPGVLEPAIRAGKVGFLSSDALWLDIGSPALWFEAEVRLRTLVGSGGLPGWLLDRLGQSDPDLQGRFELGKSSIRLDDVLYEIEDLRSS
jgi:NDP-sugar pyrophosphorylase family protein